MTRMPVMFCRDALKRVWFKELMMARCADGRRSVGQRRSRRQKMAAVEVRYEERAKHRSKTEDCDCKKTGMHETSLHCEDANSEEASIRGTGLRMGTLRGPKSSPRSG